MKLASIIDASSIKRSNEPWRRNSLPLYYLPAGARGSRRVVLWIARRILIHPYQSDKNKGSNRVDAKS